jgi:hypothetical protein
MGSVISLFVVQSVQAFISNTGTTMDLMIIVIYILVMLAAFFVGLLGLLSYKKGKFNGSKTQIALKHPLKTSLLNAGMILFILFHVLIIIYSLLK